MVDGKALLRFRVPCSIVSPWTTAKPASPTVNHPVVDHTSGLKLIESVFDVPPLAARGESNDVGNLLSVINLANAAVVAPSLPRPGYVFPSSFCFSISNPTDLPAGVKSSQAPRPTTLRDDEEGTTFLKMINSGMLKRFPGYR